MEPKKYECARIYVVKLCGRTRRHGQRYKANAFKNDYVLRAIYKHKMNHKKNYKKNYGLLNFIRNFHSHYKRGYA